MALHMVFLLTKKRSFFADGVRRIPNGPGTLLKCSLTTSGVRFDANRLLQVGTKEILQIQPRLVDTCSVFRALFGFRLRS